ncbi:unnamed protein product, partial [Amoebophrya sp. A120]
PCRLGYWRPVSTASAKTTLRLVAADIRNDLLVILKARLCLTQHQKFEFVRLLSWVHRHGVLKHHFCAVDVRI